MQKTLPQSNAPAPRCPACGEPLPQPTAFCPACGAPLLAATGRLPASFILAGRYRVVRLLARGGMGAVYLAEDLRLEGAQVAVKEMSSSFARGDTAAFEQAVADFKREAALLARLRHPNLPRVSDRFEQDGKHFLVMEYIQGQTLRDRIRQAGGRLPLDQALACADQLCEVLGYLHGQQPPIVYRDLKPANIMIDEASGRAADGASRLAERPRAAAQLVLIDFGIARFYRPGASGDTAVYGTLGYAPPEQYGKGLTDTRTDIYALGVLLHHMLTGHDPAATPFALPAPRALAPSMPAHVAAAIERATASDPERRFANIGELRAMLRAHDTPTRAVAPAPRHGPAPAPRAILPAPESTPRPSPRRRWPAWLLGALALLAVGALLLLLELPLLREYSSSPRVEIKPVTTSAPRPSVEGSPAMTSAGPLVTLRASGVRASGVLTPSIDSQGNPVTYGPEQAVDGADDTAWRMLGDGAGQWLMLDFAAPVVVARIGIIPGYDKVDPFDGTDRFDQNRVVRRARLEFSDGSSAEMTFERKRDMQFLELERPVRATWLRIVVVDTYPPAAERDTRDTTPISEVMIQGYP